jgi:GTP-binding protein
MADEDSFTPAEIEQGRLMFAGSCDFAAGVDVLPRLPDATLPEVAFAGRSNVGKSSLINAITGQNTLARVSHTPGRTQQLNFFDVAGRMFLVDMPGYGYAKVSKEQRAGWESLIRDYLRGRPTLRCVFVLVDSRHGLKDVDEDIMSMLDEAGVPYRIVLTMADKGKKGTLDALIGDVKAELKKHTAAFPEIHLTSAHEDDGIAELRALMHRLSA